MHKTFAFILSLFLSLPALAQNQKSAPDFFDLSAKTLEGKDLPFSRYRGQVVLVVNTASQCGFTPQLGSLQKIYDKFKDRGFVVFAFPSNDFKQEKSEGNAIQSFAKENYQTTFPFFEKAAVRGEDIQPVYKFLTSSKSGIIFKDVAWNFEKFLVNRRGEVVERWSSITKPDSKDITRAIEKALAEPL